MSMTMEDDIKRWTAKRKAALVMEIIQGKTTILEASRSFDIAPWSSPNSPDTLTFLNKVDGLNNIDV